MSTVVNRVSPPFRYCGPEYTEGQSAVPTVSIWITGFDESLVTTVDMILFCPSHGFFRSIQKFSSYQWP